MDADAKPPNPTVQSAADTVVDLPALYLRRLAVHQAEQRRHDETDAANAEADEGTERLRQAGLPLPHLQHAPDSSAMLALRASCIEAAAVGEGPEARELSRRRQGYWREQMAFLGDHEEALARRDQVRAALARAETERIQGETARTTASNERLSARLLALGIDPDAEE